MDGITFGYLSADQWLYLRQLCAGQGRRLDAAAALTHARSCRVCVYQLAEIAAAGPAAATAATEPVTRLLARAA